MSDRIPESGPRVRDIVSTCRLAYHRHGEGTLVLGGEATQCAACGKVARDYYEVRGHRFHQACLVPAEAESVRVGFAGNVEFTVLDAEAAKAVDAALSKALHAALHALELDGVVRAAHTLHTAIQRSDDLAAVAAMVGRR